MWFEACLVLNSPESLNTRRTNVTNIPRVVHITRSPIYNLRCRCQSQFKMGASDSKLVFKKGIFRLSENKIIPADDPYWASVSWPQP